MHIGKFFALPNGDYYPFGKESRSSVSVNKPRENFTGYLLDAESSLLYAGARYYNFDVARWVSVDPALSTKPQDFLMEHGLNSLSPYQYVRGNPINRIDPDGMTDWGALFRSGWQAGVSTTLVVGGFSAMVAAGGTSVATAGVATPFSAPLFVGGLTSFAGGIVGVGEAMKNMSLALKTPDGMTAENFSIIKETVKGLGGNEITQDAVKLIVDASGLKGASKLGEEGVAHLTQILEAAGATSENIVDIIDTMSKPTKDETKKDESVESK